jgi:hypothetical protein
MIIVLAVVLNPFYKANNTCRIPAGLHKKREAPGENLEL